MNNFFKGIPDRLKQLKKNPIWIALNESLPFNLIKAFVIILLLVWLIFQIQPRNSYIYADIECSDNRLKTTSTLLNLEFTNCNYIYLDTFSELEIPLSNITVDTNECLPSDILLISKDEGATNTSLSLSADPDCTISRCNSKEATFEAAEQSIYSNEVGFYLCGPLSIDLNECSAAIKHETGEITALDTNNIILESIKSQKQTEYEQSQLANWMKPDGTVSPEYSTEYEIHKSLQETWEKAFYWSAFFNCTSRVDNMMMHTKLSDKLYTYVISSPAISSITCTGSGSVDVSMSPVPNQYTSKLQELNLQSKNNQLSFEYDTNTQNILITGFANKATLSNFNLFPDFWNWYISNVYMAPLTLISIVFTGVSLMYTTRKKNKKVVR